MTNAVLYWEDLKVGEVHDMGSHALTAEADHLPAHYTGRAPVEKHAGRRPHARARIVEINQNGEVVMTNEGWGMFGRRPE